MFNLEHIDCEYIIHKVHFLSNCFDYVGVSCLHTEFRLNKKFKISCINQQSFVKFLVNQYLVFKQIISQLPEIDSFIKNVRKGFVLYVFIIFLVQFSNN